MQIRPRHLQDLLIQIQESQLQIRMENPRVILDQHQQWAELGLRRPLELSRQIQGESRRKVLQGIATMAQEGDQLARGQVFAQVVRQRLDQANEVNVDVWPKTPLAIEVDPGQVQIDYFAGSLQIDLVASQFDVYA